MIREYRRRQECILSLLDQITGLTIITAYVRADRQTGIESPQSWSYGLKGERNVW